MAFKHPSDDPVLKTFELALTGAKTEDLLSVRFDRTSGEQDAYVSAFAAEGVGAARSSAAHKCASRLAFRVVSALNDDPAVTKSMIFNTRLRTLIVSSYRMLAHRDVYPPEMVDEGTRQLVDELLGANWRVRVQEVGEAAN